MMARSVKSRSQIAHPVHDKLNSILNTIKLLQRRCMIITSIGIIKIQRARLCVNMTSSVRRQSLTSTSSARVFQPLSRLKMLMRSREVTPAFKAQTPAIRDLSAPRTLCAPVCACAPRTRAPANRSAERKLPHEY